MELAKYIHIFALVVILIGTAIAFNAIQMQSLFLTSKGESTSSFFVSASSYVMLFAAAFLNQWIAYRFYQPELQTNT